MVSNIDRGINAFSDRLEVFHEVNYLIGWGVERKYIESIIMRLPRSYCSDVPEVIRMDEDALSSLDEESIKGRTNFDRGIRRFLAP